MNEFFIRQKIEAVWRAESAIIVASITRIVGDIGIAEDVGKIH